MSVGVVLGLFAGAFALSTLATYFGRGYALRIGLSDAPDGFRKLQHKAIPLVGGLAICLACFTTIGAFLLYHHFAGRALPVCRRDLLALAVGGFMIVGLGFADDLRGLSPRTKLAIQTLAATVLILFGFRIHVISNPFGEVLALGLLSYPITLVWILACTNAVNLIDGLDGLASGVMLIAISAILVLSVVVGNMLVAVVAIALAGAILGFLLFNVNPASAFLGDSGSMLLGFLYSAVAFRGLDQLESGFAFFVPLIIFGLPIIDMTLAMARRYLNGLPIFSPDRLHLHHRLLDIKFSPAQTVMILYGMCIFLAVTGTMIAVVGNLTGVLILAGVCATTLLALRILWGVWVSRLFCGVTLARIYNQMKRSMKRRQQSLSCWIRVQHALAAISKVQEADGLWQHMMPLFAELKAERAQLTIKLPGPPTNGTAPISHLWYNGNSEKKEEVIPQFTNVRLPIRSNGHFFGMLNLFLSDETQSIPGWYNIVQRLGTGAANRLDEIYQEKQAL